MMYVINNMDHILILGANSLCLQSLNDLGDYFMPYWKYLTTNYVTINWRWDQSNPQLMTKSVVLKFGSVVDCNARIKRV